MDIKSRIILQSDWKKAISEKDRKIWFHYRKNGKTAYQHITRHGDKYICDDGFSFSTPCPNTLRLNMNNSEENMTFISPCVTFSSLHTAKKVVNSIDVTDGGLGVSADSENNLCIWQTDDGTVRRNLHGHAGEVYTCRFFPSGLVVLSSGSDMQLKVWCAQRGVCAATLAPGSGGGADPGGHTAAILDTVFIDRGKRVLSASKDGSLRLWDVSTQTCLSAVINSSAADNTAAPLADPINCCVVQSAASLVKTLKGDVESAVSVALPSSPNSADEQNHSNDHEQGTNDKIVLAGHESGRLVAADLRSKSVCFSLRHEGSVNCCSFLETEWSLSCGTQCGSVINWDARNTSSPIWTLNDGRSQILALKMLRTPDNRGLLAATGDGSCCLIGPETGDVMLEFSGPDCEPVTDVSTDDSFLYTSARDGCIRKYKLPNYSL